MTKKFIKILFIALMISSCRGTEKTDDEESNGSSGDATKDVEVVQPPDPNAGFNFVVQDDAKYVYTLHRGTGAITDDWSVPCKIAPTATGADKNITCIVEAHELDLFFFGVGLRFNVPPSMCTYIEHFTPYFYQFLPGGGVATVIDNRAGSNVNGGVAAGSISPYLTCPFDYSPSGPNCCIGKYSLFTYKDNPSTAVDEVTVETKDWGGLASNCLAGPAMTLAKEFLGGYPKTPLLFVEGVGFNLGYFVPSPISKSYYSNIYAANYYVAADHVLTQPLATTATGGFTTTQLTHQVNCYDRAMEIQASIKLMVRDWNTVSELALGASGNPDVGGNEPTYGTPYNDFRDYKDMGEAYPGGGL